MRKIELIELGLNEIARECRIIDDVTNDCKTAVVLQEAKGFPPEKLFGKMAQEHEDVLKVVHSKVVELLDYVGEYMNNTGMVTGVEAAISKTIYELVYERKTEKDYE